MASSNTVLLKRDVDITKFCPLGVSRKQQRLSGKKFWFKKTTYKDNLLKSRLQLYFLQKIILNNAFHFTIKTFKLKK